MIANEVSKNNKAKRFTYNIPIEQKNILIKASIQIISESQNHVSWFNVLSYIIDSFVTNTINDITIKSVKKVKNNYIGSKRKTYNITSERKNNIVEVAKKVSEKLQIEVFWTDILSFMIDFYINDAIDKMGKNLKIS